LHVHTLRLAVLMVPMVLVLLGGCREQDPPPQLVTTPSILLGLTGGGQATWRMALQEINGQSDMPPPCLADDDWIFRADSTFEIRENVPCGPGAPPSLVGTWRTSADSTRLILTTGFNEAEYDLMQLTEVSMRLGYFQPNAGYIVSIFNRMN
jgi:hypothetical protein